ncbi:hypothetical protein V6N13_042101 [Hibiscus sabdariffa]
MERMKPLENLRTKRQINRSGGDHFNFLAFLIRPCELFELKYCYRHFLTRKKLLVLSVCTRWVDARVLRI